MSEETHSPVFLVTNSTTGERATCSFWCSFCRKEHTHGRLDHSEIEYRVAHCFKTESPLRACNGYGITTDPKKINAHMMEMWEEIQRLRYQLETP
jgi:hypothetical protein